MHLLVGFCYLHSFNVLYFSTTDIFCIGLVGCAITSRNDEFHVKIKHEFITPTADITAQNNMYI